MATIPAPRGHRDPVEEYRPVLEAAKAFAASVARRGEPVGGVSREEQERRIIEAWVVERGQMVERACRRGALRCAEELCRYCGGIEPLLEPSACDAAMEAANLALQVFGFRAYPGSLRERMRMVARTVRVLAARRFGWCASMLAGLLACPKGEARSFNIILKTNWAAQRAAQWFQMPERDLLERLVKLLVATLFRTVLTVPSGLIVAPRRSLLAQAVVMLLLDPKIACGRVMRHIEGEEDLGGGLDDIDRDPFEGMSWREREEALRALERAIDKIMNNKDLGVPEEPELVYGPLRVPILGKSMLACIDQGIEIVVYGPSFKTVSDMNRVDMLFNGLEGVLDTPPVAIAWKRL